MIGYCLWGQRYEKKREMQKKNAFFSAFAAQNIAYLKDIYYLCNRIKGAENLTFSPAL